MKKMLYIILILVAVPLLYVGGNILYAVITKFKPEAVEQIETASAAKPAAPKTDSVYNLLIWNIGYGGLGAEVDFFYDDGKMVISPENLVRKYTSEIYKTIERYKDYDFILLQEVDVESKRSYRTNQAEGIKNMLAEHRSAFAVNYDVKNLPFPWTQPLGKIKSGVMSLSKQKPAESVRVAFPGITDFPRKLFYLERCMIFNRYKLDSGKDLIIINTHLEAYDDGGVKREQMKVMKAWATKEFEKGNYVIIGGDWNIAPPGFDVHKWEKVPVNDTLYKMNNDANYIPGWQFAFDENTPTNRKNDFPLNEKTFTTVIDYFLVSPNVEVVETKGVNEGFKNSDHNPVSLSIRLK